MGQNGDKKLGQGDSGRWECGGMALHTISAGPLCCWRDVETVRECEGGCV